MWLARRMKAAFISRRKILAIRRAMDVVLDSVKAALAR
jgi:hypothetical protein